MKTSFAAITFALVATIAEGAGIPPNVLCEMNQAACHYGLEKCVWTTEKKIMCSHAILTKMLPNLCESHSSNSTIAEIELRRSCTAPIVDIPWHDVCVDLRAYDSRGVRPNIRCLKQSTGPFSRWLLQLGTPKGLDLGSAKLRSSNGTNDTHSGLTSTATPVKKSRLRPSVLARDHAATIQVSTPIHEWKCPPGYTRAPLYPHCVPLPGVFNGTHKWTEVPTSYPATSAIPTSI